MSRVLKMKVAPLLCHDFFLFGKMLMSFMLKIQKVLSLVLKAISLGLSKPLCSGFRSLLSLDELPLPQRMMLLEVLMTLMFKIEEVYILILRRPFFSNTL
jgi:hypothetical protein